MPDNSGFDSEDRRNWLTFKKNRGERRDSACLTDERLASYVDGYLSRKEMMVAEEHLSECETCWHSLVALRALLDEELLSAPDELLSRIKDLVPETDERGAAPKPANRFLDWLGRPLIPLPDFFRMAAVGLMLLVASHSGLSLGFGLSMNTAGISTLSAELMNPGLSYAGAGGELL